jgi:hypothetical protein
MIGDLGCKLKVTRDFFFKHIRLLVLKCLQSVKGKVVTVHDMKDKWRNGGTSPLILGLCSRWQ